MNRSKLIVFICLIFVQSMYAQNMDEVERTIENLSKTWEISGIINPDKTEEELKETFSFIEATTLQLNNDFTSVFDFILVLPGTWKLQDEHTIIVNNSKGETKWIIHSLKQNELILSRNDAKQKLVFTEKQ